MRHKGLSMGRLPSRDKGFLMKSGDRDVVELRFAWIRQVWQTTIPYTSYVPATPAIEQGLSREELARVDKRAVTAEKRTHAYIWLKRHSHLLWIVLYAYKLCTDLLDY